MIDQSFIDEFRDCQQAHVRDLSRLVTIGFGSNVEEDCPNCTYDYIDGSSGATFTNFSGTVTLFSGTAYERTFESKSFKRHCPVCGGVGYFSIPNEKTIQMHVHWATDQRGYDATYPVTPIGFSGQNSVKLKTNSSYYSDFSSARYFIVDGIRVEPASTPVIRSIKTDSGIVEIWCRTTDEGKETNS